MDIEKNNKLFDNIQMIRDRGNDLLPSDQTFVRDLKYDVTFLLNEKQKEADLLQEQITNISNNQWIVLKGEKAPGGYRFVDDVIKAKIGAETVEMRSKLLQLKYIVKELQRHIDFLVGTGYAISIMNKNEKDLYRNQV